MEVSMKNRNILYFISIIFPMTSFKLEINWNFTDSKWRTGTKFSEFLVDRETYTREIRFMGVSSAKFSLWE